MRESSSARGMYLIAHACIPYKHGTKCVCTPPTLLPMPYLEKYDFGNLGPTAPCSYNRITREDAVVSCCWSDRPRRFPSRPPPPPVLRFYFERGWKAGNYLGSGVGIVFVVLGRRVYIIWETRGFPSEVRALLSVSIVREMT